MWSLAAAALVAAVLVPHDGPYVSARDVDAGGTTFTVVGGAIRPGAVAPTDPRCTRRPVVVRRAIRLDGRSFRYTGHLRGGRGRLAWRGRWRSATRVAGTVQVSRGRCSATVRWRAVLRPRERNSP